MKKFDIAIVGAGPAGLSFANSLSQSGLQIAIVELLDSNTIENPAPDGREIALTHLSLKIMQELGIWDKIPQQDISYIKKAHVVDGDSDYTMEFDTEKSDIKELGYMVPNYSIRKACYAAVKDKENVTILNNLKVTSILAGEKNSIICFENGEQLKAKLVVGADSRFSATRRMMGISADMYDFGRCALVCRMSHEKSHQQTASECFHYERTLAVLPLNDNISSIVITLKAPDAAEVLAMSEAEFNADVAQRFGNKLGKMQLQGKRFNYPLVATYANKFYAKRFALIGDAAVGMHPVTAHGFNLGLRSQNTLTKLIVAAHAKGEDFAATALLGKYNRQHRNVSRPLYLGTNGIVGLFTDDRPIAKLIRKGVLRAGNRIPILKKFITNQLTEESNSSILKGILPQSLSTSNNHSENKTSLS
ncbi:Ubiquinone biosynthesis hydroxylase, UbiH/UbiF/VisC/COQ6 family [hydrothermal vent metagenome]|uniref:Ubiquinone biosynthesis hydroxylase, UbiH/UbiF/VisC/COQ6 family n=2 Tax=hydrothermal vent metagenome TaxID=652676 RepID=A0A3B0USW1_9ZZZZ